MEATRPTTAITLDTSHPKTDGTLPIKLRVISERKPRYYAVTIETREGVKIDSLTPGNLFFIKHKRLDEDNPKLTYTDKKMYKEISLLLADKENYANEILYELKDNFTFDAFKDRYTGKKKASDPGNVFLRYAETIKDLQENNQFGTASSYDLIPKERQGIYEKYNRTGTYETIL